MAAIARVKCDRCGTETNDNTSSMDGWIKVTSNYFYPKQKDEQLSPDLCPSCRKSFFDWIKKIGTASTVAQGRDTSSVQRTSDYKENLDAVFPSQSPDFGKPQQLEFGGQDRPSL